MFNCNCLSRIALRKQILCIRSVYEYNNFILTLANANVSDSDSKIIIPPNSWLVPGHFKSFQVSRISSAHLTSMFKVQLTPPISFMK